MRDDPRVADFIDKLWFNDVSHGPIPEWVGAVVEIISKRLNLGRSIIAEEIRVALVLVVAHASYLKCQWPDVLGFLLLYIFMRGFPCYRAGHEVVLALVKSA